MTEFVFLRPIWLLAIFPAGILLWILWQKQTQKSSWKSVIVKEFQPILLKHEYAQTGSPIGYFGLSLIWLAAIFALAGPSFHSEQIETQKSQTGSVIVLDLSLSMFADDLKPNRLIRVQHKLTDLLKTYPELRLGMVAYSGSAHLISPIADDNQIIANLIPHLDPRMMPAYGANAVAGFELAADLIQGAKITQGHIIWITDDVETNETSQIAKIVNANNLSVSILAVGTQQGGAIKIPDGELLKDASGNLVQASVPLTRLRNLAGQINGTFQQLQLNNSDLPGLKPNFYSEQTDKDDQKNLSQAVDYGVYLLGFILALAAFGLRRGWLLKLVPLLLLPSFLLSFLLGISAPNQAFAQENPKKPEVKLSDRWREMYLTDDQRGYQAWLQQDYISAEREFADEKWRGASLYKQGKFAEAAEIFAKDQTAIGKFNLGNAYAQMNQLVEAKLAYQAALELEPEFESAKKNLKLVDRQLNAEQKKSQELQDEKPDELETNQQDKTQPENLASQENEQEQTEQQNQQPITEQENVETTENQQTDNQQSKEATSQKNDSESSNDDSTEKNLAEAEKTAKQASKQANDLAENQNEDPQQILHSELDDLNQENHRENQEQTRERQQANEAWLNQIEDKPAVFLQRKFDYQYQKNTNSRDNQKTKQW